MRAEISGEERKPIREELRRDSEIGGVVVDQERVVGSSSEVVVHGFWSRAQSTRGIAESRVSSRDEEDRQKSECFSVWLILMR